jgi:hypothetical protein
MMSERGALRLSAMRTTPGRVLAAMPMSTSQTSGDSFGVENVQNFLFDLAAAEYVSTFLLLALASEKFQVMPEFTQDRLGLMLDLFEQDFLCAQVMKVYFSPACGKTDAILHLASDKF